VGKRNPAPSKAEAMNEFPNKEKRIEALRSLLRGGGAACAPMAGITDHPFRRICRSMGSLYVTTELLSSEGWSRGNEKTLKMASFGEEERPLGIQLFGADPGAMAESARRAAELGPDFIDINFGCPVKKIVKSGGGSACMKNLPLMEEIVRAVDEAIDLPVSMKIRAGWDEQHLNAPEAAEMAQRAGLAFVTVHGRSRTQFFKGEADLGIIRETRQAVDIPIVGNGDVVDAASYQRMIDETGVDTVLVGRGCIGNPWIFGEIEAHRRGDSWEAPGFRERIHLVVEHLAAKVEMFGEKRAVVEFRKQVSQYLKGLPGASELRASLFIEESYAAVEGILLDWLARQEGP